MIENPKSELKKQIADAALSISAAISAISNARRITPGAYIRALIFLEAASEQLAREVKAERNKPMPAFCDGDQPAENPRCPICDEQMELIRERFGPDYYECRNVDCPNPDKNPVPEEEEE